MSKDAVKAFYEAALKDRSLCEELKPVAKKEEQAVAELISLAAKKGYSFDANDLAEYRESQATKLSSDVLDNISAARFRAPEPEPKPAPVIVI